MVVPTATGAMTDILRRPLTHEDYRILEAIGAGSGGYTTSSVRVRSGAYSHPNQRIRAQWIRERLIRLKEQGLVDFLDDQKPVCWKLTEKGVEALLMWDRSTCT
jgi:hypothetical protein